MIIDAVSCIYGASRRIRTSQARPRPREKLPPLHPGGRHDRHQADHVHLGERRRILPIVRVYPNHTRNRRERQNAAEVRAERGRGGAVQEGPDQFGRGPDGVREDVVADGTAGYV